jgi:hypothetical protein
MDQATTSFWVHIIAEIIVSYKLLLYHCFSLHGHQQQFCRGQFYDAVNSYLWFLWCTHPINWQMCVVLPEQLCNFTCSHLDTFKYFKNLHTQ